ncbi:MAG: DUF6644 family protein [Acidobacteriota bacterium]
MNVPLSNSWIFPIVQSIHLAGIACMVGAIVLIDVRVLGFAPRGRSVAQLAGQLATWSRAGLAVMFTTGPMLFFADASRYSSNPAFRVKMALLLVALVFHFTIHRQHTRLTAIVSIVLWSAVVIGGRAIADFDV